MIGRYELRNDDELLAWMLEQNAELEQRKDKEWLDINPGNKQWKTAVVKVGQAVPAAS